jgi:hypothetical protein
MSEGEKFSSNWVQSELDSLRTRLKQTGKWQEAIDRLLEIVADTASEDKDFTLVNEDMISLIVNEAYDGVDIESRYPAMFKEMLRNGRLMQDFIEGLDLLEREYQGQMTPLPQKLKIDLAFLESACPKIIEATDEGEWRVSWQCSTEHLEKIFAPLQLVFREDGSVILEEPWFILLRDEVEVEETKMAVLLEGTLSDELPGSLNVFLKVALTHAHPDKVRLPRLQATLRWGGVLEETLVSESGRAEFSSVAINHILDHSDRSVSTDLELTLQRLPQ